MYEPYRFAEKYQIEYFSLMNETDCIWEEKERLHGIKKFCPKFVKYFYQPTLLKWMLVTCFGYTGYRNAKFGRIEVHEKITSHAREILLQAKACAETLGFDVLHGIVDCIWVRGSGIERLKDSSFPPRQCGLTQFSNFRKLSLS
jgi:DNA polymerase elongation subunit (family B)